MKGVLSSLQFSSVPEITSTQFYFFKSNYLNVIHSQYNIPVEEIKGVGIINKVNQGTTNQILNYYISKFNSWGYIPFTVDGLIIYHNVIYYLKYGLGAASIEVKVSQGKYFTFIYYTAKISSSENANYLNMFARLGWSSVFN